MYTANELFGMVNHYIDTLPYNRKPESLYAPIRYVLSLGGKRIRPILMLLSYNLFKDNPEQILSSACALETYHNYTLLHDDLMDKAPLRRGKPTVHCQWNENMAILSGDSMLVLAYERMAQCEQQLLPEVLELFTQTALEIGEGQQYDMEFETRNDVTEQEYIEMIRLKTSVLLACAMKMGAILAHAPKEDADLLYKAGEQIGLAFQLQDDYLDVYGDSKVFGKKIGGDIVSNKKTYMLINALHLADEEQRLQLNKWLSKTNDDNRKIRAITRLYNKLEIDKLAKAKIDYYFDLSKDYLNAVYLPEKQKMQLRNYLDRMLKRKR